MMSTPEDSSSRYSWETFFPNKIKKLAKSTKRHVIAEWLRRGYSCVIDFALKLYEEIHAMEQLYIKLPGIYPFVCQLMFFIMCDLTLNAPQPKVEDSNKKLVMGLTTLLFYSVVGYFTARVKDICGHDYSRPRNHNNYEGYAKWILKIVLEWSKAATVIVCLREQGIKYQPCSSYSLLTFLYYLCTEKVFLEIWPKLLERCSFETFDTLEHLYVPIFLNVYAVSVAFFFACYLCATPYMTFALSACYFTVYLRIQDLFHNYVKVLRLEKRTFASFRAASERDIEEWNDICAVCLSTMSRARITPCNHMFHPQCLKQCLKMSLQCPLCKRGFLEQ